MPSTALWGYNLAHPKLNPEITLSREGSLLLHKEKVRPDFLWEEAKLIVEYDGAYHGFGDQPLQDEMRKTVLESMGYTVMQLKKEQVENRLAFDGVVQAIARAIGKRLRPTTLSQDFAREELRAQLLRTPKDEGRDTASREA